MATHTERVNPNPKRYYNLTVKEVLSLLKTNEKGLTEKNAKRRIVKYGYNEIKKEKRLVVLKLFLRQFKNPLVLILIIAALISFLIQSFIDAAAIIAILIINAGLGFFQEYKAEKAIALLKKITAPKSAVIRDGREREIPTKNVVPGDILLLDVGDKVGADARIIEAIELQTDESVLTGESTPVSKRVDVLRGVHPVAEQKNIVFCGTTVTSGKCKAVVFNTGMNTEFGKIAGLVQKVEEVETPLQKRLAKLGGWLGLVVLIVCFFIFLLGIFKAIGWFDAFLTATSLAVSAVPSGLPAVITICLALGVQRMLRRKALVRKLQAIETLGSTTVICADKTGTLTENEMTVSEIFVNDQKIKVTGRGYELKGEFLIGKKRVDPGKFGMLLKIASSCNNASLPNIGSPTEIALLVAAAKAGITKMDRVDEIPFTSERKFMATLHRIDGKRIFFVKGATEKILEMSKKISKDGKIKKLTKKEKEKLLEENRVMAKKALRVLAMAYGEDLNSLTFVGLMGMIDPPRKEVPKAVKLCKKAGIKVIMITGDHRLTATAIAEQIGIGGMSLEGKDLDRVDDEKLKSLVNKVAVFARVNPEHKVRILRALQRNGEIVAMTGDGVNDAPALKKSDVGVAMAIKGTDVSKEASDIILLDDNFSSIVSAVSEGRRIYDNIKKFIKFLLAVNFDEIAVIAFALFARLPLPLLPLQILWINLVTDGLPALSLSVEPAEKNIMKRKPRDPKEGILSNVWLFILIAGLLAFAATIAAFFLEYADGNPLTEYKLMKARTMALTVAVMFELFLVFSCRSERSIFKVGFLSNPPVIGAVVISIFLHLGILYTPLNAVFGIVPLGALDWLRVIALSSIGFIFLEVWKTFK